MTRPTHVQCYAQRSMHRLTIITTMLLLITLLLTTGAQATPSVSPTAPAPPQLQQEEPPAAPVTEALEAMHVDTYHARSQRGEGIRVAVIDRSYQGLFERVSAGEVPDTATAVLCDTRECSELTLSELDILHREGDSLEGVASAEVIHDMAPAASLYLIKLDGDSEVETAAALAHSITYLIEHDVQVITLSTLWPAVFGSLNGSDVLGINAAIDRAIENNILVVTGAGNARLSTYAADFHDPDCDGWHTFKEALWFPECQSNCEPDGTIDLVVPQGGARLFFRWGDVLSDTVALRAASESDYTVVVEIGNEPVEGMPYAGLEHLPIRFLDIPEAGTYQVRVGKRSGDDLPFLLTVQSGTFNEYNTTESSLWLPADSPAVLTVGAVNIFDDTAEEYSSAGPTRDERSGPDLASYGNVSTASYQRGIWEYPGTGAAAAHAAGAAAVVWSGSTALDAEALRERLISYAQPKGSATRYGAGILKLPVPSDPAAVIIEPTQQRPAVVGSKDDPSRFFMQVRVTSSAPVTDTSSLLSGLDCSDFIVSVSGKPAPVASCVELADYYQLDVNAPTQDTPGAKDVAVTVRVQGRTVQAAQPQAIIYTADDSPVASDVMLIIDHSGSMSGAPLESAKAAAQLFVNLMRDQDWAGVGSFSTFGTLNMPLTPIGYTQTFIFGDDVEAGGANWVADPTWARTTAAANSGSHAWSTGVYTDNADISLQLQNPVTITRQEYLLNFWHRYYLTPSDYGYLEVSPDGGTTWEALNNWAEGGYNRVSGTSTGWESGEWQLATVDLSAYADQAVLLRFRLTSSYSGQGEGWFIDDITIGSPAEAPKERLLAAVDAIVIGGGTSVGAGLDIGFQELTSYANAEHNWAIVLLSDGQDGSPYVQEMVDKIKETRITVYAIGLGGANADELFSIANQTNGMLFLAPTESELIDVYNAISGQVARRQTVEYDSSSIAAGESKDSPIYVDDSVDELVISLTWNDPANPLQASITRPGSLLPIKEDFLPEGVLFFKGDTYLTYRIRKPALATGAWNVTIASPAPAAPTTRQQAEQDFTFQSQVATNLTVGIYTDKSQYERGELMHIQAVLNDASVETNISAIATITDPQNNTWQLTLRDDGEEGDRTPGDGVYSAMFARTAARGQYTISVEVTSQARGGEKVQRIASRTVATVDGLDSDNDGIPDHWEDLHGMDKTVGDAGNDPDGDGLNSRREFDNATNPFNAQSDDDGIADGAEVNSYRSNPLDADSDGGGTMDGTEAAWHTNMLDQADDAQERAAVAFVEPVQCKVLEDIGTAQFALTLDGPAGADVALLYATSDITATAEEDYTPPLADDALAFDAEETSQVIEIPIIDDILQEADEAFTLEVTEITGESGMVRTPRKIDITILDNDVYSATMTPVTSTLLVQPGEVVTRTLQITNTGEFTSTFNLELSEKSWATSIIGAESDIAEVGPLAPGETTGVSVTVEAPPFGATNDSDMALATLTPFAQDENLEPTILATSSLTTVIAVLDATFTITPEVAFAERGGIVNYTLTITNISEVAGVFEINLANNAWDTVLERNLVGPLQPGASAHVLVRVTIPDDAQVSEIDTATLSITPQGGITPSGDTGVTTGVVGRVYLPRLDNALGGECEALPGFDSPCEGEEVPETDS